MTLKNLTKSQALLYDIIQKAGGINDKTRLAKLQYFADFIHYAFNDAPISEQTNVYEKRKQGPLSISFNNDLNVLKEMGLIEEKPQFNFSIKKKVGVDFSPQENTTIDYVMRKYRNLSYEELMDICHAQVPHLSTNEGGIVEFFTAYNLVDDYPDYAKLKTK